MLCNTRFQYEQNYRSFQQPLRKQYFRVDKVHKVQGILDSWRRSKGLLVQEDNPKIEQKQPKTFAEGEDEICPVECVLEIFTPEEFKTHVQGAAPETLVVCDFFKSSCGACKYIQPGFVKICKSVEAADTPAVQFIKHNVFDDEEEELTDLARKLKIKMVPLFHLYKKGELLDSFPTREKKKLLDKINQNVEHGNIRLVK
eukprot:TRINITY_DN34359_c0_g1_i1.p2 TRINITY_DN34359_c0_g1~~TRINITY_DN34359_c0_g1_i1.p2  ORF type:complete len:200 (+),score=29.82 TRINITY_DN34359_c0_g1_i1:189-788(+)